jgi:hypothetical protein
VRAQQQHQETVVTELLALSQVHQLLMQVVAGELVGEQVCQAQQVQAEQAEVVEVALLEMELLELLI